MKSFKVMFVALMNIELLVRLSKQYQLFVLFVVLNVTLNNGVGSVCIELFAGLNIKIGGIPIVKNTLSLVVLLKSSLHLKVALWAPDL